MCAGCEFGDRMVSHCGRGRCWPMRSSHSSETGGIHTLMGGQIPFSRSLTTGTDIRRTCLSVLVVILVTAQTVTCQSASLSQVPSVTSSVVTDFSSSLVRENGTESGLVHPTPTVISDSLVSSYVDTSSPSMDFLVASSQSVTPSSRAAVESTPVMPSLDWAMSSFTHTSTTPSSQTLTLSANTSESFTNSLSNTLQLCCDMSSAFSVLPTMAVTTPGASVTLNGTGDGGVTSTHATSFPVTTPGLAGNATTTGLVFGNGSCSGNNTGCPEYNGKEDYQISTPVIIGVACGAAFLVIVFVGTAIFMLRRRGQLATTKSESNYWDDNVTLSYINGHMDLPRDFADEMISLDNDSFLNSLDNMSYVNYPSANGTTKHTVF